MKQQQFNRSAPGRPFVCPQCKKSYETISHLRLHLKNHDERPHKCPKCSFSAFAIIRLDAHQRAAVYDPPAKCSECKFTSCTTYGIGVHRNQAHKKTNLKRISTRPTKLERATVKIKRAVVRKRSSPATVNKASPARIRTAVRTKTEGEVISVKNELKVELNSERIIFSCPYCEFKSPLPDEIRSHMKDHVGIKPYKCEVCPYKTGTWKLLKRHVRIHTGEKPYSCKICRNAYTTSDSCRRHSKLHFRKKSVNVIAAENLTKKSKLTGLTKTTFHDKMENGDKVHTCIQCNYACKSTSRLTSHVKRIHPSSSQGKVIANTYPCHLCPYSSKYNYILRRHIQSVHPVSYPCKVCDFRAHSNKQLERHLRIRHEDQAVKDIVASADAGNHPGLRKANRTKLSHISNTTEDKLIKCPLCDFTCTREKYLLQHSVIHSKVRKSHCCSYCPHKTFRKHDLMKHERIHTG